jgi:hypothetical protein
LPDPAERGDHIAPSAPRAPPALTRAWLGASLRFRISVCRPSYSLPDGRRRVFAIYIREAERDWFNDQGMGFEAIVVYLNLEFPAGREGTA